ncbi:hypothetical protein EDB84DRAFT_1493272 [Lactarius hengduanensis]|nr:hypothetical protein EDB84DRAFT_1493272 [Lactarius hengduanensis]
MIPFTALLSFALGFTNSSSPVRIFAYLNSFHKCTLGKDIRAFGPGDMPDESGFLRCIALDASENSYQRTRVITGVLRCDSSSGSHSSNEMSSI